MERFIIFILALSLVVLFLVASEKLSNMRRFSPVIKLAERILDGPEPHRSRMRL